MARNPLIGFLDTSKKPPRNPGTNGVEERQLDPETPTLEYYEGDNNAWRGTEMHGVKPIDHAKAYEISAADNAPVISHTPVPHEAEPIDVRIVNEYARELRTGQLFSLPVNESVTRVVGLHDGRSKLTIRNTGAAVPAVVYLSTESSVNPITSFRLETGAEIALTIESELYAVCAIGAATTLQVIDEYPIKLPN